MNTLRSADALEKSSLRTSPTSLAQMLKEIYSWDFLKDAKEAENKDYYNGLIEGRNRTVKKYNAALLEFADDLYEKAEDIRNKEDHKHEGGNGYSEALYNIASEILRSCEE